MKKWKFLFWFVLIFILIDALRLPFTSNIEVSHFVKLLLSTLVLLPLYGFSYGKAIGFKSLAIGIFGLSVAEVTVGIIYFSYNLSFNFHLVSLGFGSLYIGYLLLRLYPQFLYAFKSNELWQKNT